MKNQQVGALRIAMAIKCPVAPVELTLLEDMRRCIFEWTHQSSEETPIALVKPAVQEKTPMHCCWHYSESMSSSKEQSLQDRLN